MSTLQTRFAVLQFPLWLALFACGGGGQYNYARSYHPLRAEKAHFEAGKPAAYEDVKRDPNGFQATEIAWFGVVQVLGQLPDGRIRVGLSLRSHQDRHLCSEANESSCRLTVAERDLGPFSADLQLTPEQKAGPDRVGPGSLLKVYGRATGDYDDRGGPILSVTYFRHWPRGTYVTTAQRAGMRR